MTIQNVVIVNEKNNARHCTTRHCFNFVFIKVDGNFVCPRCNTCNVLAGNESEGPYPRPGRELTDRYHLLPRYSFIRGDSSIKRVRDRTGRYRDDHDVAELLEAAQDEINQLKTQLEKQLTVTASAE